ncbi:MAG: hypothetical protein U1E40_12785 [Amaricoccus sp.]
MKAAIGSLLFLWSRLERSLASALEVLGEPQSKLAHGPARRIEAWSSRIRCRSADRPWQAALCDRMADLLRDALGVRNLVCHGLEGIAAQGHCDQARLTVALGENRRVVTWGELQAMFDWMSQADSPISLLTRAALDDDPVRSEQLLLAYKDFPRLA